MSGRCEKHDNWHAHCQRCCAEEIERLRADLEQTRAALRRHCNGSVLIPCTMCGDSTFDHECNDRMVPCSYCAGIAGGAP